MTRRMLAAVGLLVGLAGPACAWHGPQPLQTFSSVAKQPEVVALDEAAWELVAIKAAQVSTAEDGRTTLKFELVNLSDKSLAVQVQTIFRDADGMLTGDETAWEMLTLTGNGSHLYQVTSLQPGQGSYLVQVKTP